MFKRLLICGITVAFLLSMASCTYAENTVTEDYLTYTVPDGLIAMTVDSLPSDVMSDMGKEETEVKEYLTNNMIKVTSFYKATKEDGTVDYPYEFFITEAHTSYSQNVFDFNRLGEADLEINKNYFVDIPTAEEQGYKIEDLNWAEANGAKYLTYKYNVEDEASGIQQYGEQYMTIYNGNIYCFSAISYEGYTDIFGEFKNEFFSSIGFSKTLEATEAYDPEFNTLPKTLKRVWEENTLTIIVGLIVFAVLIAFIVYSVKGANKNKPKKDGTVRADYLH